MAILTGSAESNRAVLRYIPEVVWGTTPGTGIVREMRITSSSIAVSKDTKTSDELRADRMVGNIIEVAAMSGGDVDWEFSGFTHDDFFQQFLLGAWTQPMNGLLVKGSRVSVTGVSQITIAGIDYTGWLVANRFIKLEGFATLGNNGYFSVASFAFSAGNTVITVAESTLTIEAGNAFGKLTDGNDLITKSTSASIGAANTVSVASSGTPLLGKGLKVGQKVRIEGLGREVAEIEVLAVDPVEGSLVTLRDGVNEVIFEVRTDPAQVAPGNIPVTLSATEATMASNLAAAVNAQFRQKNIAIYATVAGAVITLSNGFNVGGDIEVSQPLAFDVLPFTGGDASKAGVFTIQSLGSDNRSFTTVEPLTADANASSKLVYVLGSHLRNPGDLAAITKQSVSIETGFTDIAKYFLTNGLRIGSFSMEIKAGEIMNGTYSFMGRKTSNHNESQLDKSPYVRLEATATEVMNATANVGQLTKNGAPLASALMSIELEGDASLRNQPAVGEKFPAGVAYGRFQLKGKLMAYFQDYTWYTDFLNHETVSLGFNVSDIDRNTYYFTLPAIKILSDPINAEGIDKDVMEELDFEAYRDAGLATQFMIDRFSSVWPSTQV